MNRPLIVRRLQWEWQELLDSFRQWRFYRTLIAMFVGITVSCTAINGIVIPHNLLSPGISGLSLVWYYVVGWPSLAVIYLVLNIPLFLLGWWVYALKYLLITIVGVFTFAGALWLTGGVVVPIKEPLLAAILAGALMGTGSGLYLRMGGSAGGLDILAALLKRRLGLTMGTVFNGVNLLVLAGAWLIYDLDAVMYSGIFMWVLIQVLEKVQTGFSERRAVFIISDHPEAVAAQVLKRLDRGVTFFHGAGSRSSDPKKIVYTVINMVELGRLKELMFNIDPDALVVVYNTAEVIGGRFLTWEDEGYRRRAYEPQLP